MANLKTLNAALFRELERIENCSNPEELKRECERAEAVSKLAGNIIDNGKLALSAARMNDNVAEQVGTRKFLLGDGNES